MKPHEGQLFEKWLIDNGYSVDDIASKIGVARQTIYHHLKKEVIADSFKHKLVKYKLYVFDNRTEKNSSYETDTEPEIVKLLKELNEVRKELDHARKEVFDWKEEAMIRESMVRDRDVEIIDLKKKIKDLEKELATISNVNHG